MRRVAVLSMHTSPLAQPGTGDGGGMNVYVRELSAALARAGLACDVYTRRSDERLAGEVAVEPGFRVVHVDAGPPGPVAKEGLFDLVPEFTAEVGRAIERNGGDVIHANYWLSGVAGHSLKHALGLPLVSTFHTLDRVKAEHDPDEKGDEALRARAEADIIGCSDAILASCIVEADQLVDLYAADPTRIEIVAPAVEHAFFAPGDKAQARRALGFPETGPLVLFVGRIQPLKGADVAVQALGALRRHPDATLVIVGGPSGVHGQEEVERVLGLAADPAIAGRVRFVDPQPHELLSSFYRAADVVLVPSRSESFGLVALEASACGIPVVASAVGGLQTLVDDGITGFLVEGRDPVDYAARLDLLLSDRALAARMGAAAAANARRYTWSIAAGRLRRLYTDLTARALVECR